MAQEINDSDTCEEPTCSCHGPNTASDNGAGSDRSQDTVHWVVEGEIRTGALADYAREWGIGQVTGEAISGAVWALEVVNRQLRTVEHPVTVEFVPRYDSFQVERYTLTVAGTSVTATVPTDRGH